MALIGDAPALQHFAAATSVDFAESLELQWSDHKPIDLSNARLDLHVKRNPEAPALLEIGQKPTLNGSEIRLTEPEAGRFVVKIDKRDFQGLQFGDVTAISARYDLVLTRSNNNAIRLAAGNFIISKGITYV